MHGLLERVYHLNQVEITVLVIITAFLLLYLVYRIFGIGAIVGLTIIYILGYILYVNNIFDFYKAQDKANTSHMQEIQKEVDK